MGLWLKVHREVAGAWRSACYDVCRHANRRRAAQQRLAETAEVGPRRHRGQHVMHGAYRNRVAATTGVALLVAGGAAGTYLAVASSLAPLRPEPYETPVAAPAAPATSPGSAPSAIRPAAPQPTQARPQAHRNTSPQLVVVPEVPAPPRVVGELPTQQTTAPESAPAPSPSVSPSETAGPSPSVSGLWPSPSWTNPSKRGQITNDDATSGQSGDGR
ncbi:hypothetical protein ABT297_40625 [Dactylosporangium sp. NPDC000555]|uniref:hypothetical protein n=1 Tax=Dactylosporangium sp. NPDC000555 TaxID=3154260 RepID=UPI00331980B2